MFPTIYSHSFSSINFIIELKISLQKPPKSGVDYIGKLSSKIWGRLPPVSGPHGYL